MSRAVLVAVAASVALCACTPSMALTVATREATPAAAASPVAIDTASTAPSPAPSAAASSTPVPITEPRPIRSSATPEAFWAQEPAPKKKEDVEPTPSSSTSREPVDVPITTQPAPVGSFVLGDSILLSPGVGPVLQQRGYLVAGTVGQGASSGYLTENLTTGEALTAPAWVIELGTNNSGDPATVAALEGMVDLIDELRDDVGPQHVYWVLPYRPAEYVGGMSAYSLDAFEAEIERLAKERTWLTALDFASAARANPQWFDADNAMHLHPDEVGQDYLLRLIAGSEG